LHPQGAQGREGRKDEEKQQKSKSLRPLRPSPLLLGLRPASRSRIVNGVNGDFARLASPTRTIG
jgi:hypothetical protein